MEKKQCYPLLPSSYVHLFNFFAYFKKFFPQLSDGKNLVNNVVFQFSSGCSFFGGISFVLLSLVAVAFATGNALIFPVIP